jgi:prepilin-type N-terminal cleavage/methylation domain-containing protein
VIRHIHRGPSGTGFSLLEVLIAVSILAAAIGTVAQLSVVAARANTAARTATFASLLAAQKMEQLRALTWGVDAFGQPIGDTTTDVTTMPPRAHQGVGLTPSPGDALQRNVPGYCDFLDAAGRSLGGIGSPPDAIYVRRWSIEPLPSGDATLVLQVLVLRMPTSGGGAWKGLDAARFTTLKTRTSW